VGQLDIEELKQDMTQVEKVAELVAARAENLAVELKAPDRTNRVEKAYVTQDDPEKRQLKAAAIAGAVTFFLVLGFVAWREHGRQALDSAVDLSAEIGIPVMGTVPAHVVRRDSPRSDAYRNWQGALMECVDGVRTRLVHAARKEGVR